MLDRYVLKESKRGGLIDCYKLIDTAKNKRPQVLQVSVHTIQKIGGDPKQLALDWEVKANFGWSIEALKLHKEQFILDLSAKAYRQNT